MLYTKENDWAAFIGAKNAGELCEIDEEIFDYFLEVLPPQFMNKVVTLCNGIRVRAAFGFAEGAETITAFWSETVDPTTGLPVQKFFCQNTNMEAKGY